MNYVCLCTKNCIVTGEPAICYTGHVVAECNSVVDENGHTGKMNKLRIIAGFKDMETLRNFNHGDNGYAGEYCEFMGVQAR